MESKGEVAGLGAIGAWLGGGGRANAPYGVKVCVPEVPEPAGGVALRSGIVADFLGPSRLSRPHEYSRREACHQDKKTRLHKACGWRIE